MNEYGIIIKKFRENRGITQLELAKKAKIGNGTIGDIERGVRKGKLSTLNKIANALELNKEEKEVLYDTFLDKDTFNPMTYFEIIKKLKILEAENKELKELIKKLKKENKK